MDEHDAYRCKTQESFRMIKREDLIIPFALAHESAACEKQDQKRDKDDPGLIICKNV